VPVDVRRDVRLYPAQENGRVHQGLVHDALVRAAWRCGVDDARVAMGAGPAREPVFADFEALGGKLVLVCCMWEEGMYIFVALALEIVFERRVRVCRCICGAWCHGEILWDCRRMRLQSLVRS
jgi:hypothetical protein